MFLTVLFLASQIAYGQARAPGTPVVLTKGFPIQDKNASAACRQLTTGDRGIVRFNPTSNDQTVYVEWMTLGPECQGFLRKSFVPSALLQQTGPAPKGAKIPKVCIPKPVSKTPEARALQAKWQEENAQRSNDEVDRYIGCYVKGYDEKYKKMADIVAQQYAIDPVLLKCLVTRESSWDPNMISCGCAIGLGQQIRDNIDRINGVIGDSASRVTSNTLGKSLEQKAWDIIMRRIANEVPGNPLTGCNRNFNYSQELPKNSGEYKEQLTHREKCGPNAKECKLFGQDERRCAPASLAGLGAYLRLIKNIVTDAQNCGQIEDWQVTDSLIVSALAYNSGEGTAQKALVLGNPDKLQSAEFLEKAAEDVNRKKELQGHLDAVRNCMLRNITVAPWVHYDPKLSVQKGPDRKACVQGLTVEANAAGGQRAAPGGAAR